ncbi:MAG: hypothetical protein ACUZ8A_01720, partial [Candidatus Bathyanammoxibius sp.]
MHTDTEIRWSLVIMILALNVSFRVLGYLIISTTGHTPETTGLKKLLFWGSLLSLGLAPVISLQANPAVNFFLLNYTGLHVLKLIDYHNRY